MKKFNNVLITIFFVLFFNQANCMGQKKDTKQIDYFEQLLENTTISTAADKNFAKLTLKKFKAADEKTRTEKINMIQKRKIDYFNEDALKSRIENAEDMYDPEAMFKPQTISISDYKAEILSKKEPDLCLFKQCDCQYAPLSKRMDLEKLILQNKNLKALDQKLNYMSFGPGLLQQDLKIITDLVSINNKKFINIHLVDIDYDKDFIESLQSLSNGKKKLDDVSEKNFIKIVRLMQFIKVISEIQKENVNVIVYKSLNSYIENITKNPELLADIATIIDFEFSANEKSPAEKDPRNIILESGIKEKGILCSETDQKIQTKKARG